MDDLISRQAAIDALQGMAVPLYKDPACEDIWERDRTLDNAIDAIRGLPSAQPEIIRCKDCRYQCKGQNECETWNLCGYRPWQYTPTTDEHFCSYAERRNDE